MYILTRSAFVTFLFNLLIHHPGAYAQVSKADEIKKVISIRNEFCQQIKTMGYRFNRKPPRILMDNPSSFGNYDDTTNVLHTCDWETLPSAGRDVFNSFAAKMGHGITGEKFFELAVYKWIFVHELGHWWRACQHKTDNANPYLEEVSANRIVSAYWHERDAGFYQFMMRVFQGVTDHEPSPVPPGVSKEKYLNEHYPNFPTVSGYTWYQATMIIAISKEKPLETFKQAVKSAGNKPI